ncbi:MAG: PEGA domain-containing protein [Ignavibacteriae bacterium]|nr:PEGA domain-containing protein [Ignavibacteriota bacterium]
MSSQKIIIFVLIITCVISSCSSESPTITETGNGKVFIQSNVQNGEIFLDGSFSGKFTPDTLELLAVKHLIKVRKQNYFSEEKEISILKNKLINEDFILNKNNLTKFMILEAFTNSFCDTCDVEKLFSKFQLENTNKIFVINYPSDYPFKNDVFYFAFFESVTNRKSYYNISQNPLFVINGIVTNEISEIIESETNKKPKIAITVMDSLVDGNGMLIDIFVDVYDLDEIDFNNLILRNAVIENEIIFSDLSSENSDKKIQFLLRKFSPDYKGISLSSISEKGRAKFAELTLVDPRWNKENLYVISFIQNELTKEVLQVGISK